MNLEIIIRKGLEKKAFFLVLIFFGCSILFVAFQFLLQKEKWKVGVMMPIYGKNAFITRSVMRGVKVALRHTRVEIDFVTEDVICDAKSAKESFERFADEGITVIIGPNCLDNLTVLAGLSDEKQVLIITPSVTKEEVENAGEYVFRTIPSIRQFSQEFARIIHEQDHQRLAILHPSADEYQNVVWQVGVAYENLGGKVVSRQTYNRHSQRLDAAILRLRNDPFDVVLLFVDDVDLTEVALKRLSADVPASRIFIVDDRLGDTVLATKFAEGTKLVLPSVGNADFYERFSSLYQGEKIDFYAAAGYNAAMALSSAFQAGHHSAREIRRFFYQEEFHGSSGIFSFNKFGDIVSYLQLYEVRKNNLCLVTMKNDIILQQDICINPFSKMEGGL